MVNRHWMSKSRHQCNEKLDEWKKKHQHWLASKTNWPQNQRLTSGLVRHSMFFLCETLANTHPNRKLMGVSSKDTTRVPLGEAIGFIGVTYSVSGTHRSRHDSRTAFCIFKGPPQQEWKLMTACKLLARLSGYSPALGKSCSPFCLYNLREGRA